MNQRDACKSHVYPHCNTKFFVFFLFFYFFFDHLLFSFILSYCRNGFSVEMVTAPKRLWEVLLFFFFLIFIVDFSMSHSTEIHKSQCSNFYHKRKWNIIVSESFPCKKNEESRMDEKKIRNNSILAFVLLIVFWIKEISFLQSPHKQWEYDI